VAAHGPIELTVIFIAGGCGLMLGWAMLRPGLLTRRDSVMLAGRQTIVLIGGCVPLLVIAGLIEGFISPSDLPGYVKAAVALADGTVLYAYLLLAGRETSPPGPLAREERGDTPGRLVATPTLTPSPAGRGSG